MPCEDGNVAIAGHRTTYGKPFANVDRLAPGDQITLVTPLGSCVYQVSRAPFVVLPFDSEVVGNTRGQHNLTLTTCHPKGSASQRLIVRATMVSSTVA
jgi:sortase A